MLSINSIINNLSKGKIFKRRSNICIASTIALLFKSQTVWNPNRNFNDFSIFFSLFLIKMNSGGRVPSWLEDNGTGVYKRSSGRPAGTGFDEDAIKAAFFRNL